MKKEYLESIGRVMKKHGLTEWEINKDLKIAETAEGSFQVFDGSGGLITLDQLTSEQKSAIREEFNLKGGESKEDYDSNPLIPGNSPRPIKKPKSENEYDKNPLIPD